MFAILPKWGGSADDVDRVVRQAVEATKSTRGHELYALLYDLVSDDFDGGLFESSKADWLVMRQGFRDLFGRYPDPVNVVAEVR